MQAQWDNFFAWLLPGHSILREIAGVGGIVEELTVRKSGTLLVRSAPDNLCPPGLLCRLEEALEQKLETKEVIVSQQLPAGLDADQLCKYTIELVPWMLRHLRNRDALLASLLRNAKFKPVSRNVEVHLQADCCEAFADSSIPELQHLCSRYQNLPASFCLIPVKADIAEYTRKLDQVTSQLANEARAACDNNGNVSSVGSNSAASMANSAAGGNYQNAPAPSAPPQTGGSKRSATGAANKAAPRPFRRHAKAENMIWGRLNPELKVTPICEINSESGTVVLEGETFGLESREISQGTKVLVKFAITDLTSSVSCILFAKPEDEAVLVENLKSGYVRVQADISFDSQFANDLQARIMGVQQAKRKPARQDNSDIKRVELHAHTKMSTKDAVCDASDLVKLAASFGQPAVAITDHGVVQSFPDACNTQQALKRKGKDIKVIYGLEGYLVDDGPAVCWGYDDDYDLKRGFVAVDVETTGLDAANDRVIEVAAVKFVPDEDGGWCTDERFVSFINPGVAVPEKITELTGITTAMIADGGEPLETISNLAAFIGDFALVAHNAFFDLGFLRYEGFRTAAETDPRVKFNMPIVDTLALSRALMPEMRSHKLNNVCEALNVNLGRHHRAEDDALACGEALLALLQRADSFSMQRLNELVGHQSDEQILAHRREVFHIILLARDYVGLYNLYRLVSASHTKYFHSRPRIPRSLLQFFRHGLITGSACEAGEIYQKLLQMYRDNGSNYDKTHSHLGNHDLVKLARFYDYLEIQPVSNNQFYLRDPESGIDSEDDLKNLNKLIVELGVKTKRPVLATCDVHFLEKRDSEYRKILMADMGFSDAHLQPDLYFRTTEEMLQEFSYLGQAKAREVAVDNPLKIADQVKADMKPFPDGSFPPIIASAADDVRKLTWDTANSIYGYEGGIPDIVRSRVERELDSIIDNGFAIMYYIAHKLVKKSNDDGYIVGSRGSVGSSLVATFCGITEVNPLPPHHVCPHCHYSEFDTSGDYGSGYDLPAQDCPHCGSPMTREGQDIPFETFLGFNGDKQPDIDLNFSGEYQPRAHRFIEEMFGSSHTFRAGTIGSFAEKNAQGMVRGYFEKQEQFATKAEVLRLSQGLIGVKRTTGQHPGGIVVVPKERDVYDFTPIQHPADKREGGTVTTHFDFNAMHDTILKLDILGHDDPTMLKMLGDLTAVDVNTIPIPDEKVMSLFTSTEALGIPDGKSPAGSATLGLPEMGTFMARDMIKETRPSRFYDLVQLMGLSHGTDVWKGNAQELIRNGTCSINEVIGCRDTIMTGLIYNGLPPKAAFDIMEKVRKGKGLSEEHEQLMRDNNVPEWYIDSCKKIKYMFPKAHAAAYTISSLRIAWFKVYYPEAYYCAYFTVRADEFDSNIMCRPPAEVRIDRERRRQLFRESPDREQKIYYILELVEEMQLRGIDFLPLDVYKSSASKFVQEAPGLIRPPLDAIPGISSSLAQSIIAARADGIFKSKDELMRRAGVGQSAIETLTNSGCLQDMPDTAQMNLFEMMG
ncbi:MAG: PolC-type DNA polymerase III [Eubacteriales bacterium]|nr:PolC-type DNA polymerase III [Eubacteriales bacterium]MDD4681673.1 PolC-type DNA polymerase III [Eubacteriales bacterium]